MSLMIEREISRQRIRAQRFRLICKSYHIVLGLLIVLCVALYFERHDVLEIRRGEISLFRISTWGCCKREVRRLPVRDVSSIRVVSWGSGKAGGCVLCVYDNKGQLFNEWKLDEDEVPRVKREMSLMEKALRGELEYCVEQETQGCFGILATALVFIEIFCCFVRRVSVKDRADVAKNG